MRYILDDLGYIEEVTFGGLIQCNNKSCTEYTGKVPEGYESLEEWDLEANIRAYKIVDGNLVYDDKRDAKLQEQCEIEAEKNATSTHEWTRNLLEKTSSIVLDEFSNNETSTSLIVLEDSGAYEIPSLIVSSETIKNCNIVVSNKNLLGIEAVTQTISGVTFTINEDGSITLNGTSTEDIELNLKGTSSNLDMLFLIQQETNYVLSGLATDVNINLYNLDDTDKTLIGTFGNELINLSDSYKITQVTLTIASGKTFEDVIIKPQIEINDVATEYVIHEEQKTSITLNNNEGSASELFSYNPTTIIMADEEIAIEVNYFRYKSLEERFAEIAVNEENINIAISKNTTSINNNYQELLGSIEEMATTADFEEFQKTMQTQMDASKLEIVSIQKTITDGVEKVVTTSGTFDDNGLTMDNSSSKTKTILDETGVDVVDKQGSGDDLLFAGYVDEDRAANNEMLKPYEGQTVTYTKNIIVDNYLSIGTHSRLEDYEDGTGIFVL